LKILKYILIVVFAYSSSFSVFAQTKEIDQQKAKTLWNLPEFMTWDSEKTIITLGVVGASKNMMKELRRLEKKRYPHAKKFKVVSILSPEEAVNNFETELLYISDKYADKYETVSLTVRSKGTIFISENWEEKKLVMANFSVPSSKLHLEVNDLAMTAAGISMSQTIKDFDDVKVNIIDGKSLFEDSERKLKKERKRVQAQKARLKFQSKKIEIQLRELTAQKVEIQKQKDEIAAQQARIDAQKNELSGLLAEAKLQSAALEDKTRILEEKELAIVEQNEKLIVQLEKVRKQTAVLDKQNAEIGERQSKIDKQKAIMLEQGLTIKVQENMLTIFIGVFILILILIFFILRSSRIQKKQNKLLERQKEEISEQAVQLESVNKELEKLSIVASETSSAVVILDIEGKFEWINAGYTRLYGYTLQLLQHELGENILTASNHPDIQKYLENCISEKRPVIFETYVTARTGEKIWAQTTLTPTLNMYGEVEKLVMIDSDISQIKKAEAEIIKKNKKITDSILYAKRIQTAILSPEEIISDYLPNHFIMFEPRDIVSGDFYWAVQKGNKLIVTAADCTGHGVPGAFMSMLGVSFLNEIAGMYEEEELRADLILNELRDKIKTSLRQTGKEGEAKDGMDMALCVIDKHTMKARFAGAQNPVVLIRNNEINEYKGDHMPIGISYNEVPFKEYEVGLEKGDCLYMYSDGYPDQFNGKTRRKFFTKRLRMYLQKIHTLPFEQQKAELTKTFTDWKGDYRQMDDVLVIGLEI